MRKLITFLLLIATSALIAGCANSPGDFCAVSSAFIPSSGAAAVMDNADKNWVVAHNEWGERHCNWRPPNG
jgi:hypothetical protein